MIEEREEISWSEVRDFIESQAHRFSRRHVEVLMKWICEVDKTAPSGPTSVSILGNGTVLIHKSTANAAARLYPDQTGEWIVDGRVIVSGPLPERFTA